MSSLSVRGLSKTIRGRQVLSGVDFALERGEAAGLVGINGAGKSSVLKCVAGLWRARGEILFEGKPVREDYVAFARNTGALIEYPALFPQMTLWENVLYFADFYGDGAVEEAARLADLLGLAQAKEKKLRAFSSGMKQKACLLIVLMKRPSLLLLDEPTSMLDPKSAAEIRSFIGHIRRERGISLLIASHNLAEIEDICDCALLIDGGRLTGKIRLHARGTVKAFRFTFQTAAKAEEAYRAAEGRYAVQTEGRCLVLYADAQQMQDFLQKCKPDFLDLSAGSGLEMQFTEQRGKGI